VSLKASLDIKLRWSMA